MNLQTIAARYGVPLSLRSASGGYMWNGKDLAIHYQRWSDDCLCANCIDAAQQLPLEPFRAWTTPVLCPKMHRIADHDLIHDIGHFIVAPEWARDLPEWGLGTAATEYNVNGGYHLMVGKYSDTSLEYIFDGLFPEEEANRQEAIANLIGYILMQDCGIKPPVSYRKTWVEYYRAGNERQWVLDVLPQYGFSTDAGVRALDYMALTPEEKVAA